MTYSIFEIKDNKIFYFILSKENKKLGKGFFYIKDAARVRNKVLTDLENFNVKTIYTFDPDKIKKILNTIMKKEIGFYNNPQFFPLGIKIKGSALRIFNLSNCQ